MSEPLRLLAQVDFSSEFLDLIANGAAELAVRGAQCADSF